MRMCSVRRLHQGWSCAANWHNTNANYQVPFVWRLLRWASNPLNIQKPIILNILKKKCITLVSLYWKNGKMRWNFLLRECVMICTCSLDELVANFRLATASTYRRGAQLPDASLPGRLHTYTGCPRRNVPNFGRVKLYRYNPKHLYSKSNSFRDIGKRKCGRRVVLHTVGVYTGVPTPCIYTYPIYI
jgi:hypothetical protein